jgi:hypothetical protein
MMTTNRTDELLEDFTEVELLPHLTLQDILAAGITWKDLCDCLGDDQIVWTAPGVYVGSMGLPYIYEHLDDLGVLAIGDDANGRKNALSVHVTEGAAAAAATATCDLLITLLATTEDKDVSIQGRSSDEDPLPVSAATLSRIFQENRDLPRTFTVSRATLNEEHIRALETASSPDVEVSLISAV